VMLLADLMGGDAKTVLDLPGVRAGEPALLIGDNEKLRTLGWHPAMSLRQGLEEMIE
jgi:nucleoside-diphosphate-sugar epimerase